MKIVHDENKNIIHTNGLGASKMHQLQGVG